MRLGPAYSRSEISSITAIGIGVPFERFAGGAATFMRFFELRKSQVGSIEWPVRGGYLDSVRRAIEALFHI
jgi:hypothetical protein